MTTLKRISKFLWIILIFIFSIAHSPLQGCDNNDENESKPTKFLSNSYFTEAPNKDKGPKKKRRRKAEENIQEKERENNFLEVASTSVEIPDEILLQIFYFLNQKDVPFVTRVSQRWQRLMEDNQLWKVYAKRANLIWKEDNFKERSYKALIKEHCTYSFIILETLNGGTLNCAKGVSFDGSIIAGCARDGIGQNKLRAFRWTQEEGIQSLGTFENMLETSATAISFDGTVIVGFAESVGRVKSFRWTQKEGMQSLETLNEITYSRAEGINPDGSTIIGSIFIAGSRYHEAFRWTHKEGMESLGISDRGIPMHAHGLNYDGSIIVGLALAPTTSNMYKGFRWTRKKGMEYLDQYAVDGSEAFGINYDGSVIVGQSMKRDERNAERACRWTYGKGKEFLGTINGGNRSAARAVNYDGSVIIGEAEDGIDNKRESKAFRWTLEKGMESIEQILREKDLLPTDLMLIGANAISPSGTVIVGEGKYMFKMKDGRTSLVTRAWRAIIPKGNLF